MELNREIWTLEDGKEFQKYLVSFGNPLKVDWTKNILNTKMNVLAIKSSIIKDIVKKIKKGNYLSFLDLKLLDYYENASINAGLICFIKDFDLMKKYLDEYGINADSWATCDVLSFNVKGREELFLNLINEYIKSNYPFVRRIALSIYFNFIEDEYLDLIFNTLDSMESETEYYVNMMGAWLLCECVIKKREQTIKYLKRNKTNKFIVNKGIQKCRDSYRVSDSDKELLLSFKK